MGICSGAGRCVDFRKSWWVCFYYDKQKRPVKFEGDRAYPYNFKTLTDLLNLLSVDVPEDVRLAQIEKDRQKEALAKELQTA